MAYEFYVTVEGTKQGKLAGESNREAHADKLAGLAFHYSVGTPRESGSGMPTGRRTHQPVSFVKEWGAATPQLFHALTTNESIKSVLFEFINTDETGEEKVFHTIKLVNASIAEIKQYVERDSALNNPAATGPLEEISFTFQRIELVNVAGKTSAEDESRPQR